MKKDKTGSTGNYSDHLLRIYHLENPNKATLNSGQLTLSNYVNKNTKGSKMTPQVVLFLIRKNVIVSILT
jgi:hypothetical protein